MKDERVIVIGAGVMGRGIAQICAMAGYHTTLTDLRSEALDKAQSVIASNLEKGVARGKVSETTQQLALNSLHLASDYAPAASSADIAIEAIVEDLSAKQGLLRELCKHLKGNAVIGTNTSSLSIADIASAASAPERVIGMHFFNPPHIVKLLEIVTAPRTSSSTLERTKALGERTFREMIVVRDSPGFATSRLGLVLGLEAIRMLEDGVASAEDIDRAMELGYRHPMGPLRLTDLVGLDTRLRIARYLHETLGSEAFRPPTLLERMVADGKLGKKSGQGFYAW